MWKNKIKAVIFDYDGTIVNSEYLWLKIHKKAFADFGLKLSKQQALDMRSAGAPLIFDLMKKWFNLSPDEFKTIDNHAWDLFVEEPYYKSGMKKPYIEEILLYLKTKGYILAVASGTAKKQLLKKLKDLKLDKYFQIIISTQDVKFGKPEPDVYFYTCKCLQLQPEQCLVIEDSPNGVTAACKAGCNTVMIPDLTKPDEKLLKNKFLICKNFKELKNIFKKVS